MDVEGWQDVSLVDVEARVASPAAKLFGARRPWLPTGPGDGRRCAAAALYSAALPLVCAPGIRARLGLFRLRLHKLRRAERVGVVWSPSAS